MDNETIYSQKLSIWKRNGLNPDHYSNSVAQAMEEYTRIRLLEKNDLKEIEAERLKWSLETFGDSTPISSLRKCKEEIKEIESDILEGKRRPEEYADAIMCLFDSAGRQGITVEEILESYKQKVAVNKQRKWKKNPDNSYSHIK